MVAVLGRSDSHQNYTAFGTNTALITGRFYRLGSTANARARSH
jgi:hypothetical protein